MADTGSVELRAAGRLLQEAGKFRLAWLPRRLQLHDQNGEEDLATVRLLAGVELNPHVGRNPATAEDARKAVSEVLAALFRPG
jgi:hypothetical protein